MLIEPFHRNLVSILQRVIIAVGLVHQASDHLFDDGCILGTDRSEVWSLVAKHIWQLTDNLTGDVAALDGTLIDVLLERIFCTTEE